MLRMNEYIVNVKRKGSKRSQNKLYKTEKGARNFIDKMSKEDEDITLKLFMQIPLDYEQIELPLGRN